MNSSTGLYDGLVILNNYTSSNIIEVSLFLGFIGALIFLWGLNRIEKKRRKMKNKLKCEICGKEDHTVRDVTDDTIKYKHLCRDCIRGFL